MDHFVFLVSGGVHKTLIDGCTINGKKESFLQLQVSDFCEDICLAVEKWLQDISFKKDLVNKTKETVKLYESGFVS